MDTKRSFTLLLEEGQQKKDLCMPHAEKGVILHIKDTKGNVGFVNAMSLEKGAIHNKMEKETCKGCGETKWGDSFPDTDSVCHCDEEEEVGDFLDD